ncbi:hypothetical protein KM043_001350 [Ampulex compressa]|nr:hypothetical protein KM043_001350 [Ampulex compressa]
MMHRLVNIVSGRKVAPALDDKAPSSRQILPRFLTASAEGLTRSQEGGEADLESNELRGRSHFWPTPREGASTRGKSTRPKSREIPRFFSANELSPIDAARPLPPMPL